MTESDKKRAREQLKKKTYESTIDVYARKASFTAVVGSENYNLALEDSDQDRKRFFYPSFLDMFHNVEFSKSNNSEMLDEENHDIRKIPRLLFLANVNFLEVLFSVNVQSEDDLYATLYTKREEIARMNLPYLYDACMGMAERKLNEFNRDSKYIETVKIGKTLNMCDFDQMMNNMRKKVSKHAMVAYRILDVIARYAKNQFTDFQQAIRYVEDVEADREMKAFLIQMKQGDFSVDELEVLIIKKKMESETFKNAYKEQNVDDELRGWIEDLIQQHLQKELLLELTNKEIRQGGR